VTSKLNAAYVLGSVVIAALVGAMSQSWLVFVIAAALLIALCLVDGTIRPKGRNR
jgi:hypothetical protein